MGKPYEHYLASLNRTIPGLNRSRLATLHYLPTGRRRVLRAYR